MRFGRALRAGLSSLRDRAAARLAGSRFNPSRVIGYAMIAVPFVALAAFFSAELGFLQVAVIFAGSVGVVAWCLVAVGLTQR